MNEQTGLAPRQADRTAEAYPRLGLVCITAGETVRFRTLTRTRYLQLDESRRLSVLSELYRSNLERLQRALHFCHERHIHLYRISSGLFPFSDEEPGGGILRAMAAEMALIGQRAAEYAIRLLLHPDQFVVLSSDSDEVVRKSIIILEKHAATFDLFGLPCSAWAAMNIHGGKTGRADKLVHVIGTLPDAVRSRLTLENDEHAYGGREILDVCMRAEVPMIFDNHHHACHEGLVTYEDPSVFEMVLAARATWPVPAWQIVHLSNGRDRFSDPRHSDLITTIPSAYAEVPWIEVEAKAKEEAIERLRSDYPDWNFG